MERIVFDDKPQLRLHRAQMLDAEVRYLLGGGTIRAVRQFTSSALAIRNDDELFTEIERAEYAAQKKIAQRETEYLGARYLLLFRPKGDPPTEDAVDLGEGFPERRYGNGSRAGHYCSSENCYRFRSCIVHSTSRLFSFNVATIQAVPPRPPNVERGKACARTMSDPDWSPDGDSQRFSL